MKTSKAVPETKLKSGKENYGYSSDKARTAQIASLPPKSCEVCILDQHSSSSHHYQDPDEHRSGPASRPQVSRDAASPQKVRNVTLV